jgi:hypothetical protein
MEFKFGIRDSLREAWALFKKHFWFFVGVAAVAVVFSFLGQGKHVPSIVKIVLTISSFVWSIVVMKVSLLAADNKEDSLSFSKIKDLFPSWKQAIGFIGVGLLGGLLVLGGLVLLIIPGIWIAFRLSLANLYFIDKGEGVKRSLRASWDMTKGPIFWTTVLVFIVSGILYIVGLIVFGVGILVTYPLAMILMAKFYRAVTAHHGLATASVVAVQPAEIVAPVQEEIHHEAENNNQ